MRQRAGSKPARHSGVSYHEALGSPKLPAFFALLEQEPGPGAGTRLRERPFTRCAPLVVRASHPMRGGLALSEACRLLTSDSGPLLVLRREPRAGGPAVLGGAADLVDRLRSDERDPRTMDG